jgi:hypothetical protein
MEKLGENASKQLVIPALQGPLPLLSIKTKEDEEEVGPVGKKALSLRDCMHAT